MKLTSASATARVDLQGGRVGSLTLGGVEVLVVSGPKPTRWGSFPMVPWCGRLENAQLRFDGQTYDVPQTSPPHANHGFGHTQLWERVGEDTIETALGDPWPFGGSVSQRFELGDDSLTVTIEVRAGDVAMPAMAGWHPWFRRDLGVGGPAEVHVRGGKVYEAGADQIPTGALVEVPPGPWDHCFVRLESDPEIVWPGALRLGISSTFDHWVVFTEPANALCVEPQSGPPNQLNSDPVVIAAGASLTGSMTWTWEALG